MQNCVLFLVLASFEKVQLMVLNIKKMMIFSLYYFQWKTPRGSKGDYFNKSPTSIQGTSGVHWKSNVDLWHYSAITTHMNECNSFRVHWQRKSNVDFGHWVAFSSNHVNTISIISVSYISLPWPTG